MKENERADEKENTEKQTATQLTSGGETGKNEVPTLSCATFG